MVRRSSVLLKLSRISAGGKALGGRGEREEEEEKKEQEEEGEEEEGDW